MDMTLRLLDEGQNLHCKNCVVNVTTKFGDAHYLFISLPSGDVLR